MKEKIKRAMPDINFKVVEFLAGWQGRKWRKWNGGRQMQLSQ